HAITESRADEQHAEEEEQVVVAREDVLDAEEEEPGSRRWRLRAGSDLDLRRRTVAREDAREDLAAAGVAHVQVLLVTARERIEERRSKTQWSRTVHGELELQPHRAGIVESPCGPLDPRGLSARDHLARAANEVV